MIALLHKKKLIEWLPTLKFGGARKGWYKGWYWEYLGMTEELYPFMVNTVWYSYNYVFKKDGKLIKDSFMAHIDYNTDFKWIGEHLVEEMIKHPWREQY